MGLLLNGETLEDLQRNDLQIIQRRDVYRFTTDAVLLAHFAHLAPGTNVIDLGSGNGILPLLLTALFPGAKFVGVEIQQVLADMARRSVRLNELEDSIKIIEGDLTRISDYIKPNTFDTVITNPPYFPESSGLISANPSIAAAKQELMCSLEDIMIASNTALKGRGSLFMVHRPERLMDICHFSRKYDLEPKKMRFVFPKIGQGARVVLMEFVKNSSPGLVVLPPLILFGDDGKYTQEAREIYYPEGDQCEG
ncbi:MAG: tRNA1(Val) (adenine(37)-N6)-methyltransferase [Clostridia bacterium]|nr:tRNA1(Val) (adenine(37)-N6)-methyltransferase [Clostridia bacterium]